MTTTTHAATNGNGTGTHAAIPPYPFTAIVGQAELKLALLLCTVDPTIGGVMVMGHRGTAKSTAVRALAALLPPMRVVAGCPYNCDPAAPSPICPHCHATDLGTRDLGLGNGKKQASSLKPQASHPRPILYFFSTGSRNLSPVAFIINLFQSSP